MAITRVCRATAYQHIREKKIPAVKVRPLNSDSEVGAPGQREGCLKTATPRPAGRRGIEACRCGSIDMTFSLQHELLIDGFEVDLHRAESRMTDFKADVRVYREIAVLSIHQLRDLTIRLDRAHESNRKLRDENRELRNENHRLSLELSRIRSADDPSDDQPFPADISRSDSDVVRY